MHMVALTVIDEVLRQWFGRAAIGVIMLISASTGLQRGRKLDGDEIESLFTVSATI